MLTESATNKNASKISGSSRQRASASRRSNTHGYLVVDGQTQGFACSISTMNGDGADIRVSGLMGIPDGFSLFVEPEAACYRCKVLAKRGNSVRVMFESREANKRFRDFAYRR